MWVVVILLLSVYCNAMDLHDGVGQPIAKELIHCALIHSVHNQTKTPVGLFFTASQLDCELYQNKPINYPDCNHFSRVTIVPPKTKKKIDYFSFLEPWRSKALFYRSLIYLKWKGRDSLIDPRYEISFRRTHDKEIIDIHRHFPQKYKKGEKYEHLDSLCTEINKNEYFYWLLDIIMRGTSRVPIIDIEYQAVRYPADWLDQNAENMLMKPLIIPPNLLK